MLKENIFLLVLVQCLLPFTSFAQQNNFTVTGNIKGAGNDSVIIIINNYNEEGIMLKPDTLNRNRTMETAGENFSVTIPAINGIMF